MYACSLVCATLPGEVMRLILIRHPQPTVAPGVCYGSTDLAVDPIELTRVVAALTPQLPSEAGLFSSPLQRCAALAERLPYAPLHFDARLVEIDFGAWEMRPWDEIPRSEIDAWAADVINYRPGGGESVITAAARVAAFYADLMRMDLDCASVVCHAGVMRLLLACRDGVTLADIAAQAAATPHKIAYGETLVMEI